MNIHLRLTNYINRYAPSEKKLRQYLSRKNHTLEINHLLGEIGYDESLMCDLWMQSFLATHKGEREIREKLLKKGFPKDLIHIKVTTSLSQIQDWENYKSEIESKIDSLLLKGKSKRIIAMLLKEKYSYFRDEIELLLDEKEDSSGLEKETEKYLKKYDISDFKERMKFFAALERKGFSYKNISAYLEKMEDEKAV